MNVMQSRVYGASYASIDGKEYVSLYTGQSCDDHKRIKGVEVMKMGTTPEVFHSLPANASYPLDCELTFEVRAAGQNKIAMFCTSVKPIKPAPAAKA